MVRDRGQLEARVMNALWQSDSSLTAREIQADIADPTPALTTVLTVLERLRVKGRVVRSDTVGATMRFAPAKSESEDAVEKMLGSLTATADRTAALVRLAGDLDADDAAVLAEALRARRSAPHR